MNRFKIYSLSLIAVISIEMIALVLTAIYLEPLTGDLTRVAGYAENDYGWNKPQQIFQVAAPPLHSAYDHYSDILVIGDSFSFAGNYTMLNYPWQTYLTAKTGLTAMTISHYIGKLGNLKYNPALLPGIVNSEGFKTSPPRLVILEVVERQLDLLPDIPGNCQAHPHPVSFVKIQPRPEAMPSSEVFRRQAKDTPSMQIAYAKSYLTKSIERKLNKAAHARTLELATPSLLSNRRSSELLITTSDIRKGSWDKATLDKVRCQLINMMNLVESNGKTLFIAMIVPDKLTAYSRYLRDPSLSGLSVIGRLAADESLPLPRVDLAIQAAIDHGLVDVYLPNDTHWSYLGNEVGASAVADYLKKFANP